MGRWVDVSKGRQIKRLAFKRLVFKRLVFKRLVVFARRPPPALRATSPFEKGEALRHTLDM